MKKYSYMRVAMLFSMAIGICSCEGSDLPFGAITNKAIIPVVLGESMTKANDADALASLKTNGFKMDIVAETDYNDGNAQAGLYGGTRTVTWADAWSISPTAYWIDNTQMSFWAYNMAASDNCDITKPDAGDTEISFCYPGSGATADPYAQTDLLFAKTKKSHGDSSEHAADADDDKVELRFFHAMSKIQFDNTEFSLPSGYNTVEQILILGLKDSGEATFDGSEYAWSNLDGDAAYETDQTDASFLVVPQNAADAIIKIKVTGPGVDPIYLQANMKDYDMQAGKLYTYKLKVTSVSQLDLTMTVSDWDDEQQNITLAKYNVTNTMAYDGTHSFIDNTNNQIVVMNNMPITGHFTLDQPLGARLLLALDGNVGAFEIENPLPIIDGNQIEVKLTPTIADPKKTYLCHLHVFLINSDGTTEQIDDDVLGTYKDYTLILPSN